MYIRVFLSVTLCGYVLAAQDYHCSEHAALQLAKKPSYEFSMRMLQRVTEDKDSHFVYSPVSTWLELSALAEGATGLTWREIWKVTKHHRNKCYRRKLSDVLIKLKRDLSSESKGQSVIAVDSFMGVRKNYIRKIQKLFGIKVLVLDFSDLEKSANEVNNAIEDGTDGEINTTVYIDDFNSTVLLISDANYFRNEWKIPFNTAYTIIQPFYSKNGVGKVSMMNQVGYFHITDFPFLEARVLEIPMANRRITTLIFLPTSNYWIGEIFYKLQRTRLTSIFNMFKRHGSQLVNVTMPRFKQRTEVNNLSELIYDMGIKRMFNPNQAEFRGISKYKIYASLMTQTTEILVDEKGITATADFLVNNNNTAIEFLVNKPFVYIIVDRKTELILFAGAYSTPSLF